MLMEQIASLPTLREAWAKVKANAGGPGGDEITLGEFEGGLDARLDRLHKELLAGTYWPSPVRMLDIPKKAGGVRTLAIPSIVDRVAQTAAALVLTPILDAEFEDASFAYRPGRSVRQAVSRVASLRAQGFTWVVDADIDQYFDRIPHQKLLDRLERSIKEEAVCDLVSRWLDAFSDVEVGIPQGGPISPLLANLYLDEVDEAIEGKGVRLVRFADDFLLLCKTEAAAIEARERITGLLAALGLELNKESCRIVSFERGVRFLGHLFVRSLVVKEVELDDGSLELPRPELIGRVVDVADAEAGPADLPGVPSGDRAPGLRVLYVFEPKRELALRNKAFAVREEGVDLLAVPPERIDRIDLGPAVEVGAKALRHALAEAVPVAFVDGRGDVLGTLEPRLQARAALHLAQAKVALDASARVDLARLMVEGRIRNQRALLRRLNRRRKDAEVARAAQQIGRLARLLARQPDIEGLMGVEGRAGALYWPALGRCLEHGWSLQYRRRRPPPDPVNLAISYLATMLARDVAALAGRLGLHSGIGCLHVCEDGRHALALDIMEEFRAPLVEGLAVYLFNNRILKEGMFYRHDDGGVAIWREGVKALLRGYETWLDRAIESPWTTRMVRWRRLVEEQLAAYRRHVQGEAPYRPYLMSY